MPAAAATGPLVIGRPPDATWAWIRSHWGVMGDRDEPARVVIRVEGRVQGVGFRWYVQHVAHRLSLVGSATNQPDGSVEVVAEGPREDCEQLINLLDTDRAPGQVSRLAVTWTTPTGMRGFRTR